MKSSNLAAILQVGATAASDQQLNDQRASSEKKRGKGDDDFDRILRELNFDESCKMVGLPVIRDRSCDTGNKQDEYTDKKDTPAPIKRVVSQLSPQTNSKQLSPDALDIDEPLASDLVPKPIASATIKIDEQNAAATSDAKE